MKVIANCITGCFNLTEEFRKQADETEMEGT